MNESISFEDFLDRAFASLRPDHYEEHPSQRTLIAYVYEQIDPLVAARISAHLATCKECSERVHALREERAKVDETFARYLRERGMVAERAEIGGVGRKWPRIRELSEKVLANPWLSSRRGFYGHLAAWAAASGVLAFFLIRYLHQPGIVLESSENLVPGGFIKGLVWSLAGVLGFWGLTGLASHGYLALWRSRGQERKRPRDSHENGDREGEG